MPLTVFFEIKNIEFILQTTETTTSSKQLKTDISCASNWLAKRTTLDIHKIVC